MGQFNITAIKAANPVKETLERLPGVSASWKKTGNWWFTNCILHGEDTGSLHVKDSEPDWFKCEGCGKKGDVIQLVAWYLYGNLNPKDAFKEACKYLGGREEVTDGDLAAMAEQRRLERARQAEIDEQTQTAARAAFHTGQTWLQAHRNLTTEGLRWWEEERGVPEPWVRYLKLGEVPDLWGLGRASSIPYISYGTSNRTVVTAQYRIWDQFVNGAGSYRFEPDLGKAAYVVRRDLDFSGDVLLGEGAIKAIVAARCLGHKSPIQVVGLPSKNSSGGIIPHLKKARRVWILLDPDAWQRGKLDPLDWVPWPLRYAAEIGKNARVVYHPDKLDDWINWTNASASDLLDVLSDSCKV